MKKNKFLRTAAVLLALVLVSTIGMTGALAKYITDFTATSTTVRAGLFWVTGPGTTDAIIGADLYEGDMSAGENEAMAYSGSSLDIIVPGSIMKACPFTVTNWSEVDVEIAIDSLTCAAGAIPLKFSVGELVADPGPDVPANWVWEDDITDLDLADILGASGLLKSKPAAVAAALPTNEITVTPNLYILWPFGQDVAAVIDTDMVTVLTPAVTDKTDGLDKQQSANDNDADTVIGTDQAKALLDPIPPLNGPYDFLDATSTHELTFVLTISAAQVD